VESIQKIKSYLEFIKDPLLILLVGLIWFQFIGVKGYVPSGSMIPTIQIGDHILENRISYYYKDPQRFEIVIFKQQTNNLVKRVIGLPGEEVDLRDGKVYINGVALEESSYLLSGMETYPFAYSEVVFPLIVPEGEYFVLGDNRVISEDSRWYGTITRDSVFAKGVFTIFPIRSLGVLK
jgi:signal peptidase I